MNSDDPRHGTANGYNHKSCRCGRCRAAWAAYTADKRKRHPEHLAKQALRRRLVLTMWREGAIRAEADADRLSFALFHYYSRDRTTRRTMSGYCPDCGNTACVWAEAARFAEHAGSGREPEPTGADARADYPNLASSATNPAKGTVAAQYRAALDEIDRLRDRIRTAEAADRSYVWRARAERAEADADRLAEQIRTRSPGRAHSLAAHDAAVAQRDTP